MPTQPNPIPSGACLSPTGHLVILIAPEDIQSARWIINRSTNCLEPVLWPDWVRQVDRVVDCALGRDIPAPKELVDVTA